MTRRVQVPAAAYAGIDTNNHHPQARALSDGPCAWARRATATVLGLRGCRRPRCCQPAAEPGFQPAASLEAGMSDRPVVPPWLSKLPSWLGTCAGCAAQLERRLHGSQRSPTGLQPCSSAPVAQTTSSRHWWTQFRVIAAGAKAEPGQRPCQAHWLGTPTVSWRHIALVSCLDSVLAIEVLSLALANSPSSSLAIRIEQGRAWHLRCCRPCILEESVL